MDRLVKSRRPVRAQVTRLGNELTRLLAENNPDKNAIQVKYQLLRETGETLQAWDQQVTDRMVDDDVADDVQDKEYEDIQSYRETYLKLSRDLDAFLQPDPAPVDDDFETASTTSTVRRARNYKLPKVELRKFTGEIKDWIGWWSQFEKIHEDKEVHFTDKFQYLVQSIQVETEAAEIVNSYPMSASNYPKAVEALKERFGRQDLLLQVYVRELLTLVISNVTSKDKIPLSSLYLKLESHLRALATLQLNNADPATWIFPLVESSLSEETLRAWQRSSYSKLDGSSMNPQKSRLDFLMEFIKVEVQSDQQISLAQRGFQSVSVSGKEKGKGKRPTPYYEEVPTAAGLLTTVAGCAFCDKRHESDRCVTAQAMSLEERRNKIKEKNLCFNCLKSGHGAKTCNAYVKCIICSGRHYPLMCSKIGREPPTKSAGPEKGSEDNQTFDSETKTVSTQSNKCSSDVLLNALLVKMESGKMDVTVRLVVDTGSQRSYIKTERVVQSKFKKVGQERLRNVLFGKVVTKPRIFQRFSVTLKDSAGARRTLELLEKPEIGGQLPKIPNGPWVAKMQQKGVNFNDVGTGCQDVDILIGNDLLGTILTGRMEILSGGLYALETVFGWTLGGPPDKDSTLASEGLAVTSMLTTSQDVSKLWNLEALGITDTIERISQEEEEREALSHFSNTVARNKEGRYIVGLPWKSGKQSLPTNRNVAEQRLKRTSFKLKKNNTFEDYDEVFKGWEKEGIITEVEDVDKGHFICHRPVYKPGSSTPTRPVFDASCRQGNLPSLNDCLYKGPNLLEKIPAHFMRFREHAVGVTSDIRKAFLMVLVNEDDQQYLKFLWWSDSECRKVKVYVHHRLMFGLNCSPFLLNATINYHLSNMQENKEIAEKLKNSFYVDNVVTSVRTFQEYKLFKQVTTHMMKDAGMELRQWAYTFGDDSRIGSSNSDECGLESDKCTPTMPTEIQIPVLGLLWNRELDTLSCDIQNFEEGKVTKRKILSVVSKFFDPLGFTCPALLPPKLLIQESWINKLGWDEVVPEEIGKKFNSWIEESINLGKIKLTRHYQLDNFTRKEVHVMCDASQASFAAVGYMLTEERGLVNVQYLLGKSRLAPLNNATIPRLELLACWIGSCLAKIIKEAIECDDIPFYFWSDSSTALAWIRRNEDWGTFVGNRVKKILQNSQASQWFHVPGLMNSADLPSRGCSPRQLLESTWWEGAQWLKEDRSTWPTAEGILNEDEVNQEKRKSTSSLMCLEEVSTPVFSSYRRNIAIWGWVLRFLNQCRGKRRKENYLTIMEYRQAEKILIKQVQASSFPSSTNRIGGIIVSKHEDGIYRVETKLVNRVDQEDFIRPIVLPREHPVVSLLIYDIHKYYGHAGIQTVMAKLREKYWILQTRRAVRKVIHNCSICRRFEAQPLQVHPAALPIGRVRNSEAFETTGVDLAGPLYLKDGSKVWITLFTCACYRGVYLDLVPSLETKTFLGALERFVNMHGRPNTVYSDNGTNFVGAVNIFKTLDWKEIERTSGAKQIHWIFNPPTAAWWGGWWERMVRSVKDLLKRMLGKSRLTYDELRTCLSGVASTINDRPLTVISEDFRDLAPLTPSMFMKGKLNGQLPETMDVPALQGSYQRMKKLQGQLQDRFRREYLSQLVMRGNELRDRRLQTGEVVLVGADNKKRFEWPLGVVLELIAGKDGKIRVAKVRTNNGILTRPLQRLYPLEVRAEETESLGNQEEVKKLARTAVIRQCKDKKDIGSNERVIITKKGRISKQPVRYNQWLNLCIK